MLRFWLALPVLMLFGACAPFHRPLAVADRDKVQEVDVRVVVAQESFMFSAQPPGVSAATGGGLIGALIDSSVQQSRQKDMSAEVQAIVGPLLDYDARRGSELVKTLQAYFDAGGSPRHAATDLHVHVNTVSQRLERISALLGPHWQRPDDALELQLALRLMRLQVNRLSAGGSPTR